jgi:micrococcal nuclease
MGIGKKYYDKGETMYEYRIAIRRVIDGDTVDCLLDLGFQIKLSDRIRLYGIDTPESRTRNKVEKRLGLAAKVRLQELIAEANKISKRRDITVRTHKDAKGKFGRILGDIFVNGKSCSDKLIEEGHARAYFGGAKERLGPWVKLMDGNWHRWTEDGYVLI